MIEKGGYVYILANRSYGAMYIGVTADLVKRIWQHREQHSEEFTKRYGVTRLVWFEQHESIIEAIRREKQIKKWNRDWKINLIQEKNPDWADLYPSLLG